MACRIGITTNPERRRKEWEAACGCFKNWQVVQDGLSRIDAQTLENELAKKYGCDASPGGGEPEDHRSSWSVYCFEHCGCK